MRNQTLTTMLTLALASGYLLQWGARHDLGARCDEAPPAHELVARLQLLLRSDAVHDGSGAVTLGVIVGLAASGGARWLSTAPRCRGRRIPLQPERESIGVAVWGRSW